MPGRVAWKEVVVPKRDPREFRDDVVRVTPRRDPGVTAYKRMSASRKPQAASRKPPANATDHGIVQLFAKRAGFMSQGNLQRCKTADI